MNGSSDHKNFLFFDNWFKREFEEGLKGRYPTFKTALNLFLQNNGKIIVETGTLRYRPKTPEFWSDGGSTYVFGRFCKAFASLTPVSFGNKAFAAFTTLFPDGNKEYGRHFYTVDNSRKAIAFSKKFTKEFKDHITYVTNDSIEFLRKFKGKIDLLYLDSLNCPLEGDATQAQKHQLGELMTAWDKLAPTSVILLDDNQFSNGGKTRLSKQFLLRNKALLLTDAYQSLWMKQESELIWTLRRVKNALLPENTKRRRFYEIYLRSSVFNLVKR